MLRPYVSEWFKRRFGSFTVPQRMAIPEIKKGHNVLISSPTGTGKTLAVFLGLLDELYRLAEKGELSDQIYILYISPLRALDNDMKRNLLVPITEIVQVASEMNIKVPEIRVAIRTGDTTQNERQKMLKRPPHILITTPESLAIILVAPKFRERLKFVRWIIIDEIHELCNNKRGVHLSLSLERLENLVNNKIIRIGMSATISPLEEVALYLAGYNDDGTPRECRIVDARFSKPFEIRVLMPVKDIIYESTEKLNNSIYKELSKLISENRTTLVFTNTRSATERVVYKLKKMKLDGNGVIDADSIEAHHSSLSRGIRLDVEEKLKKGQLKAVVCVTGDSLVLTANGWKEIRRIKQNEEILFLDENFKLNKGNFEGIFSKEYNDEGLKIKTRLGFEIKCTKEHKFLIIRDSKLEWVMAKDLQIGDRIAVTREIPNYRKETSNNSTKAEHESRKINKGDLQKLLELHKKFGVSNEFLERLAYSDIFLDEIIEKKKIPIKKIWSLINTPNHNYVVNGFICQNSSTSLELGIDIGSIDMVALLSSPKSVSRLLQRVGRSGHDTQRISKGRIIAVDRDDLVESTVLAKAAEERLIDSVKIPKNCLDVLAQHLVGMAIENKWRIEDAYKLIKRSYNYHELPYEDFISTLRYLAGHYEQLKEMKVYAKIWIDEEEGMFGRKGGGKTRMIYYLNSGTIPDEAQIEVHTIDGKFIGVLEEEFLEILEPGDIFVLGGKTYEFLKSKGSKAIVKPAEGQRPTVPSWFSEMLPLSFDSALLIGAFRRKVAELIKSHDKNSVIAWLEKEYNLSQYAAKTIYEYIWEQLMFTNGLIPSDKLILIETFEEKPVRNIIFHTLFGRRCNQALSKAYAYQLSREYNTNVRITVTDNGFMLTIPLYINPDLEWLTKSVTPENIETLLNKALSRTEMLTRIFRHCAVRSFMILKRYMGTEKSVNKLQLSAQSLLNLITEINNFPILKEAYREILEDKMDIEAAKQILKQIKNGNMEIKFFISNEVPSPFSHSIVTQGYSDVVLMEDRRKILQNLHRRLMEKLNQITITS
ncbi:MAG: DEAD/DEAH box helicase [Thermoprotei archaeon]